MQKFLENIQLALQDIDDFYHNSFKIAPDKCMPYIASFVQRMDDLSLILSSKELKKMNKLLEKIMSALEAQDYVVVKDCLRYEFKEFLLKIQKSNNKNR